MDADGKIRATLKIVPDQNSFVVPRPSPERLQKAVNALQKLGFEVLRRTRFGVEVRGTSEQYREHLNVSVPVDARPLVKSIAETSTGLDGLVDSVEIVPAANLLV
jgi:hypothetical protein